LQVYQLKYILFGLFKTGIKDDKNIMTINVPGYRSRVVGTVAPHQLYWNPDGATKRAI